MADKDLITERTDEKLEQALALAQNTIYKQYLSELVDYELVEPSEAFLDETPANCIRMYQLEELSCKKGEDVFQKLSTVYHASMSLGCNLIVMVDVDAPDAPAKIYVGVRHSDKTENYANILTTSYTTLRNGILSNFPGSKLKKINAKEDLPLLMEDIFGNHVNHISAVSCVASVRDKSMTENKSFIQGLERLVDTMRGNTYTALLIAEPIAAEQQMAIRNGYENLYSVLSAFAKTNISMNESSSESTMESLTKTVTNSVTDSVSKTQSKNKSGSVGVSFIVSASYSYSSNTTDAQQTGKTKGDSTASGHSKGTQTTVGKTLQIETVNKHATEMLARIEEQLKRIKQCEDYGAYSCSAYFLSSRKDSCLLAANTYRALMLGDGSSVESGAINTWSSTSKDLEVKTLVPALKEYLKRFVHPEFAKRIGTAEQETAITYTPGTVVSGIELPLHLGLPTRSVFGLPVIEHAEFGRNINLRERYDKSGQSSVELGTIYHMGNIESAKVALDVKSLAMHTFVTGSTGSGKSNTVYQILRELGKQDPPVKFMVIEPAKGEYKHVFGNGTAKVFGTNPYHTPLLKINPFKFPKKIHVLEHIDRLIEIFNVCWPMYAAMPAVLKDSVERAYIATGWDLSTSRNRYSDSFFPTFVDVLNELNAVVAESAFSQEVKDNYVGSLATRIKSLTNGIYGKIFDNNELGDEILFDENIIVDLSRVGSVETKSMIMGILVMRLQEYRMTSGMMNADLQHVTVLEEAHNLLKRTSTEQSSESSNLLGKSVEMLANTIAEVRTYGEGFIIADQAPGLLDLSVIRNTNTKIIMRLPEEEDRKLVGRAANITDEQIKELSKLPTGVAAIYQNNWIEPVLCKINQANIDKPEQKYQYQQTADQIENEVHSMTPVVNFLLYSRLPELVDIDLVELRTAIDRANISTSSKIRLLSLVNEYDRTHTVKLWEDDRFDELSQFVSQLFDSDKQVESFIYSSSTFGELSHHLHTYIHSKLSESTNSLDIALSQCLMKTFSLTSPDNVGIYAAWREEVVRKGGLS